MAEYELRKTRREKIENFRKDRFESVFSAAESALKSAFLVNGGGAVALIAFFGQAAKQGTMLVKIHLLSVSMLILVIGTALAGIATGVSFLAQYGYFMRHGRSKLGKAAQKLTAFNIFLVCGSYLSFIIAGLVAYCALP